jgi:Zn-dependent metalloprotease
VPRQKSLLLVLISHQPLDHQFSLYVYIHPTYWKFMKIQINKLGRYIKASSHFKCTCFFVPPTVSRKVAATGIKNAGLSNTLSDLSRKKRKNRVSSLEEFASLTPVGKAARHVYDCQHQFAQRVSLARAEGKSTHGDKSVDSIYDYSGNVREYFKSALNRDSIDNASMDLQLNVHYGENYMNAFWDGDEMTFGDGDGNIFTDFSKSLDVVAHELGHGVTQWEANLEYVGQSGALNEHFSDVFGSVITQQIEKQTADSADWLIGDEIMGPTLKGEALRSMSNPGTAFDNPLMGRDSQPAHMDHIYTGQDDNGGVHINSGIPNRAFYLTAKEIGTDKAATIWYRALQNLWSTALFNDAVKEIVRSAGILADSREVPRASTQIIRAAFKSVGLPM